MADYISISPPFHIRFTDSRQVGRYSGRLVEGVKYPSKCSELQICLQFSTLNVRFYTLPEAIPTDQETKTCSVPMLLMRVRNPT